MPEHFIYRGETEVVEPLNEAKYDNSLRAVSLIGEFGLVICGLIGGIIGFFSAYWFS